MQQQQKEKLFTLDFILIIAVCGLGRIGNHMQSVTVPQYMQSIGYTATVAGLMTTVYTIASLALRPFIGALLDRKGRWLIVTAGTALFAVISGLFPMVHSLWLLVLLRVFHGIGFASHATAINTMGTDVLPESRLSEGIGYMGLTNSLSTAIAPALALMLMERFGYGEAFTGIFAVAGLGALLCLFIRYEKRNPPRREPVKITWSSLFERSSLFPSVMILIAAAANTSLGTFLYTYTSAVQLDGAGMFFTVNAVSMAISRLFGGKLTQRIGEKRMMYLGLLFCVLGFLLVSAARVPLLLWIAAALYGLGYGVVYPLLNAMAVVNAAPNRRGAANATFLMMLDMGIGLGAMVWGFIIDHMGPQWLYPACAVTMAVSIVLYTCLSAMKKKGEKRHV